MAGSGLWVYFSYWAPQHWPTVSATVDRTITEVEASNGGGYTLEPVSPEQLARAAKDPGFDIPLSRGYITEVDVEYKVANQEYSAITPVSKDERLWQAASRRREFPAGKVLAIHYNPARPETVSYHVSASVVWFPLVIFGFGSLCALLGVFGKIVPVTPARERKDYSPEEQQRLRANFTRWQTRMPHRFAGIVRPCPGCRNPVFTSGIAFGFDLGPYCPECGQKGLEPCSLEIGGPGCRCANCGKTLRVEPGLGANFKVNACTRCGLILVDAGAPPVSVAGSAAIPAPAPTPPPPLASENSIRSTISDRDGVLEVVIPLPQKPFRFLGTAFVCTVVTLFLVWLWIVGFRSVPLPLRAAFLLGSLVFELREVFHAVRCLAGQDRVRVSASFFELRREALGVGFWHRYRTARILRILIFRFGLRNKAGIVITRRLGPATVTPIRFAQGLDAAEAELLARMLGERVAQLSRASMQDFPVAS